MARYINRIYTLNKSNNFTGPYGRAELYNLVILPDLYLMDGEVEEYVNREAYAKLPEYAEPFGLSKVEIEECINSRIDAYFKYDLVQTSLKHISSEINRSVEYIQHVLKQNLLSMIDFNGVTRDREKVLVSTYFVDADREYYEKFMRLAELAELETPTHEESQNELQNELQNTPQNESQKKLPILPLNPYYSL